MVFSCLEYRTWTSLPCLWMQKAVSCASWEHSLGIVQVAAVHVSMYLPNSLSKASQETLPFPLLLGSSFSQLQLLPHPTCLCHPGALQAGGSSGLGEGEWEPCNTYSLTCLWAQGKQLQKAKNATYFSSSSVRRTARGSHTPAASAAVGCCAGGGGSGGEPGWARAVLTQAPALGPPWSGAGVFGLIRTFQPPDIKHLF